MDEIVARGMAKWPNVPSVYGWLALDCRGQWRIKGERVSNPNFANFIARNYAADTLGRWYFQNGPQRVFVQLHCLPYIIRVTARDDRLDFRTHTNMALSAPKGAWLDELGHLTLSFSGAVGSVHDQDLVTLLPHLRDGGGGTAEETVLANYASDRATPAPPTLWLHTDVGRLPVQALESEQAPVLFGFVREPIPAPGEPEC